MRDQAAADGKTDDFESWLRVDKPLLATPFFKEAGLCPLPGTPAPIGTTPLELVAEPLAAPPRANSIPVGRRIAADYEPVSLPTRLLPRHTAIIAGSGSGKTVLLRRIVEEAAGAGVDAATFASDAFGAGETFRAADPLGRVAGRDSGHRH